MTSDIFSDQLRGEIVAALNKDVLMKIPFFRSATFEAIQQVCAVAQERKFLAGELIYRRGEISSGLYLVRSGTVIVSPLSYSSWGGSIRRRWNPDDDGGAAALHEEIRDEGTRPMKVSYIRMKRKAKASLRRSFTRKSFFKSGRSNFHQSSSTVFPLSTTAFPVTAGSWFGESELLREIVEDSSDPSDCRRTTTVDAKSNVRLLFISKNDLSKLLFENPQILMELLICHEKRFNSADLPDDLREAFRFSDEWEDRVHRVIAEISRARQINIFPPSTLS
jgi:CRP-like cAMP-binding protein